MSIHLSRAQLLMQQHRFELAEEQLRLALSEGTDTATAHALLALCLSERNKFAEAATEAQQAIHDAPDEALGFHALATIQWKRNQLADAKTTISEAIRLEPWNSHHFHVLAGIESNRYRWSESLAAAEQGLACDPDDIGCNNLRAIALVNLGRKEEAGQSIQATLSKNPEDAVTHANQGWTMLHQRQPLDAMKHFREALRLQPDLEWARLGIVEAMKARFFVYRWLLSFFLWMTHFPPNVRLGLILGLVFGQNLLANLIQMVPILAPLALPLTIGYVLFVWMTWTASSLFNLVLRLDPFGRLVLNSTERLESNLVGLCLLSCIVVIATSSLLIDWVIVDRVWAAGMLFLGLMLPVIATFRQPDGRKKWFAAYTVGVTVCVLMATYQSFNVCFRVEALLREQNMNHAQVAELEAVKASAAQWFKYSVWGIVVSTWISASLSLSPGRTVIKV